VDLKGLQATFELRFQVRCAVLMSERRSSISKVQMLTRIERIASKASVIGTRQCQQSSLLDCFRLKHHSCVVRKEPLFNLLKACCVVFSWWGSRKRKPDVGCPRYLHKRLPITELIVNSTSQLCRSLNTKQLGSRSESWPYTY
jgi:hypothetical protein